MKALIALLFLSSSAWACNVQLGFKDSCYQQDAEGTKYGPGYGSMQGLEVPNAQTPFGAREDARRTDKDRKIRDLERQIENLKNQK